MPRFHQLGFLLPSRAPSKKSVLSLKYQYKILDFHLFFQYLMKKLRFYD